MKLRLNELQKDGMEYVRHLSLGLISVLEILHIVANRA